VELRRLRYFVAVAEELHFRRAAAKLHLAQPALSQQVRKLELELGVDLLLRTKRDVSLTPAGQALLVEARRLLRHADEAARAAREAQNGFSGRLRIGHLADSLPTLVPRTILRFATLHPEIRVSLETLPARRAVDDLRNGRLDVAVVGLPAQTTGLQVTPIDAEETVAALAERHLLSGRPALSLHSLADETVMLLPRDANPAFYDGVSGACRDAGIAPTLLETHESRVEHVLLSVASSAAVALLPSSIADRYVTPGVRFLPLEDPSPVTEIGLVTRADASEVSVKEFLRLAQSAETRRSSGAHVLRLAEPLADVEPLADAA
jgi:DNA-binding transcriptional LysR family regulator